MATAIDEMLSHAAEARFEARVLAMRAAFEARTGSYSPRDSFFEARSAAFWDDALTRGAFGREIQDALGEGARAFIEPLARAHRGLFRVEASDSRDDPDAFLLVDEWSGAEFLARPVDSGLRDALERASSLLDGRVVGTRTPVPEVVLLAGAVFHAADALEPMRALIPEARARKLTRDDFLDALLRMDHSLRALSRVKAAFAYRKEALGN
jgi:hypothetical protein